MAVINSILKRFFGTKADRDMKLIQPYVDKTLEAYARIDKLTHDQLRDESDKIKIRIADYIAEDEAKKQSLRDRLEDLTIDISEKESLATEVDKLTKKIDEKLEEVLIEVLPDAFAIMKSTARRFKENSEIRVTATQNDKDFAAKRDFVTIDGETAVWHNSWMAGGNMIVWDMVHYDVQLVGGVALHQGKISFDKDPVEYNGYIRWNSDFKKCTGFRTGNDAGNCCGRCIKTCPWNSKESSWFHEAGIWIGSKGETSAKLLKGIDDMFGYGTEEIEKYKWWLEWPEMYKFKY